MPAEVMMTALLLVLAMAWAESPKIQEGFVLRPVFETTQGSLEAGTAFAVEHQGQILALTAFHLFGPPGGLPTQISAAELPGYATGLTARDAWSGAEVGKSSGPALLLADAQPMGETAARDLAAFPMVRPDPLQAIDVAGVSAHKFLRPRALAAEAPAVGAKVYVAASLVTGNKPGTLEATVLEVNPDWIFFEYATTELDLTATSGAPLLDEGGEVVGMVLGAGLFEGKLIGSASPGLAIKQRLSTALEAAEPAQ